jgi:lysophospholipase L1-like esterase
VTLPRRATGRPVLKVLGFLLYNVVAASILLEAVIVVMLHAPRAVGASPRPVRRLIQQVYRHFNRTLIQFNPQCARYDPGLFYTLKPGACTFENIEFKNAYTINRVGVRDEEAALNAPDVIVLGDSHAMGWGVEQQEALPQLLARKSGRKVLNAAVSSYGTVREMLMLDRLDASRLRVLIVQYSDNDLPENRTFLQDRNHLPIASEAQYQNAVRHYASQRTYYPFKYVYRLFLKVFRLEAPEPDQLRMDAATPTEEAELFLNALTHASRVPLDNVQVIVFEINEQVRPSRPFIAALDEVRRRDTYPAFVRRLIALDVAPRLTPDDFYKLDDHMNARGHEVVAGALAEQIANRAGATGENGARPPSYRALIARRGRTSSEETRTGVSARPGPSPGGRESP